MEHSAEPSALCRLKGLETMPKGFYFDNARCTGCRTCVMACKDYHDHGADEGFRRVIDYEGGGWTVAEDGTLSQDAFAYHISLACNHCANPACAQVCPTEAMHRDELGLIWPDHSKCIGCGYCTMACPYHAPAIDKTLKRSSKCDGCRERIAAGLAPICVEAFARSRFWREGRTARAPRGLLG